MKIAVATIVGLLALSFGVRAEIVRCHAQVPFGNVLIEHSYEIVLPDDGSRGFVAHLSEGGDVQEIISSTRGLGIIEVRARSATKATRHDFVLLQRPLPSGWSLIGFYFSGVGSQHPTVVRADLWDNSKPFFVYDTFVPNEVGKGKCE